jgi:2-polyprenyl-3-methyl-5-hydroxy-6-metoxy-1,4-benzoquinol methylase
MSTSYNLNNVYTNVFNTFSWYNQHPHEEPRYVRSLEFVNLYSPKSILDVGSGRGNFLSLLKKNNDSVLLYSCDFNNFHNLKYVEHYSLDIRYDKVPVKAELITCLDVLEHLPINDIEKAVNNMSKTANKFVFSVSNHSDVIGGVELHLTQLDCNNWIKLLNNFCQIEGYSILNGITYFFHGTFKP